MGLETSFKNALSKEPGIITELVRLGYKVDEDLKYLASGAYAHAFLINDKYVIKFTREEYDYNNWEVLVGAKTKHLAKTLYVGELTHLTAPERSPYMIVQKYYKKKVPIIGNGKQIISSFNSLVYKYGFSKPFNMLFDKLCETHGSADYSDKPLFKQLYSAYKELNEYGLFVDDLDIHFENIRYDDKGVLKIIDF